MLAVYRSRITPKQDGWSITEDDAPKGRNLALLQARAAVLSDLGAASPQAITGRVARLFLRFPGTAKASAEQVAAYVFDLQKFPLWAIDKGIAAILSGSVMKSDDFPPSSLVVQKAIRAVLEPILAERAAIGIVLNAEVRAEPTRAERERVLAGMATLVKEIVRNSGGDLPKRDGRTASKFDEARVR